MLVVEDRVSEESQINASALNIDEFIWPHGVTPPLKHVRKRRFRKRVSRRAIEVVEEQVEELLGKDEAADDIQNGTSHDVPDEVYAVLTLRPNRRQPRSRCTGLLLHRLQSRRDMGHERRR